MNGDKIIAPVENNLVDVFSDREVRIRDVHTGVSQIAPTPSSASRSSSSSSDDEEPPPKRRRRRDSRSTSRDTTRELDRRFDLLSKQLVSHVNSIFSANYPAMQLSSSASADIQVPVEISNALDNPFSRPLESVNDIAELNVSIKEPAVPKASPERVAKIASMQRFDSSDWNSVRYTEVQKKYAAFPAFTELKVNEELRRLEDPFAPLRWYQMERSFAALSNAFLAQNEFVNLALRNLLDWSSKPDAQLTSISIYDKLRELFGNESNYKSVSHDILQIICGKRAEVLELRRKALLKTIKRKYIREDIEKIPPSAEYMFNPQNLSAYIQKIGGIDKLEKLIATPSKSVVHSRSPVRTKSPVASTSRENSFRPRRNKKQGQKKKWFRRASQNEKWGTKSPG